MNIETTDNSPLLQECIEDLQNLATLERPKNPYACTALHLALFLFYARGMCFVDVFNLRTAI